MQLTDIKIRWAKFKQAIWYIKLQLQVSCIIGTVRIDWLIEKSNDLKKRNVIETCVCTLEGGGGKMEPFGPKSSSANEADEISSFFASIAE